MRKPQRNWMLDNDQSWNQDAVRIDFVLSSAMPSFSEAHSKDRKEFEDTMNRNNLLRDCFISMYRFMSDEINGLRKEIMKLQDR